MVDASGEQQTTVPRQLSMSQGQKLPVDFFRRSLAIVSLHKAKQLCQDTLTVFGQHATEDQPDTRSENAKIMQRLVFSPLRVWNHLVSDNPVHPLYAKYLVYGHAFACWRLMIDENSSLSTRTQLFKTVLQTGEQVAEEQLKADRSDLLLGLFTSGGLFGLGVSAYLGQFQGVVAASLLLAVCWRFASGIRYPAVDSLCSSCVSFLETCEDDD